ncbi:MAG: radical SAM protein [Deltaproteobacteria bacterium]|nr:radical SAM protein [Deltaproteobacteria bacterium]
MRDEDPVVLHVAHSVPVTTAEGPGRRFALWVQGCTLRCPGCCNPAAFAPGRGPGVRVDDLVEQLRDARARHGIVGLTLLGGEPLQQRPAVTALCRAAQQLGLGVIVFSGYRWAEASVLPGFDVLWASIDTLVDGRYDAEQPEPGPDDGGRRFIGSRNQRLLHRTARYRDPDAWRGPAQAEIHVDPRGRVSVHGEPGAVASVLAQLRRSPGSTVPGDR